MEHAAGLLPELQQNDSIRGASSGGKDRLSRLRVSRSRPGFGCVPLQQSGGGWAGAPPNSCTGSGQTCVGIARSASLISGGDALPVCVLATLNLELRCRGRIVRDRVVASSSADSAFAYIARRPTRLGTSNQCADATACGAGHASGINRRRLQACTNRNRCSGGFVARRSTEGHPAAARCIARNCPGPASCVKNGDARSGVFCLERSLDAASIGAGAVCTAPSLHGSSDDNARRAGDSSRRRRR